MVHNDAVNSEQPLALQAQPMRNLDIPKALPMRLQTLDLARHTVISPDEQRYVVGTYNDQRLGRGYITAVYPQQNDYLTLVRLTLVEYSSPTEEKAIEQHLSVVQAIQQGMLKELQGNA